MPCTLPWRSGVCQLHLNKTERSSSCCNGPGEIYWESNQGRTLGLETGAGDQEVAWRGLWRCDLWTASALTTIRTCSVSSLVHTASGRTGSPPSLWYLVSRRLLPITRANTCTLCARPSPFTHMDTRNLHRGVHATVVPVDRAEDWSPKG